MRTVYSNEKVAQLRRNPCVFSCTERSVNYTCEFKKRALELHLEGVSPKEIWRRAGFDVNTWKKGYFTTTLKDWRRIVRKSGIEGLSRFDGVQFDRGPNKEKSDEVKRLRLQVTYLEAENDFLAKLRAKRAESNSGLLINTDSFKS